MTLGSASFAFTGENRDLLIKAAQAEAAAKKSYEAIAKAAGVSASDVERAANKMAAAHTKAANALRISTAEFVKGAGALVGVTSAIDVGRAAIEKVASATLEASKAQFALSKAYGSTAPAMSAWAKQFGDEIGRSTTEVQKAATTMGVLTRSYGLSENQAKLLIRQTADLAAANGETLAQSAKDVQAAIRGEAEASEKLGVALGETRVATSQLGADGQKLWATLTEEEKATLRLLEIQKQLGDRRGAAAEEANTLQGSVNRLTKATDELAVSVGESLIPLLKPLAADLTSAAKAAKEAADQLNGIGSPKVVEGIYRAAKAALVLASILGSLSLSSLPSAIKSIYDLITEANTAINGAGSTAAAGPAEKSPEEIAAEAENVRKADEIKAIAQERQALERRKKNADETLEIERDRIDREREANQEAYEAERQRLESRRARILKDIEVRRDAALAAIEAEAEASKKASEEAIEQAGWKRDAELSAIDEAFERLKSAVDARKAELATLREQEDRDREDTRRAEDQQLEETRRREDAEVDARRRTLDQTRTLEDQARSDRRQAEDADRQQRRQAEDRDLAEQRQREDRAREARQQGEDRQREERRRTEDRELEADEARLLKQLEDQHTAIVAGIDAEIDAIKRRAEEDERAREAVHEQTLAGFKAEEDAAKSAHDARMDELDDLARAEDERHRQRLSEIDAEKDARLRAIDAEFGLLDSADDAEARATRDQGLRDAVTNADFGVKRAQSTGNQSEIVKAEQELAAAVDAIRRAGVKDERDNQRAILLARKKTIEDEAAAAKQAEDERNRRREEELRLEREATRKALDDALAAIGLRRTAYQSAYDDETVKIADLLTARLEALARQKEAEQTTYGEGVERVRAEYEERRLKIEDRRRLEDERREDRRQKNDAEREDQQRKDDQDRQDRRTKEDAAIAASRLAQDRRRDEERRREDDALREAGVRLGLDRQAEDTAIAASRREQDRRRDDERKAEDAALATQLAKGEATRGQERDLVEAHYNGPQGVITRLKKAMQDAQAAYQARLELARKQFNDEREAAQAMFTNADGTGLIDMLEKARDKTEKDLKKQEKYWEDWRKSVIKDIEKAEAKLKEWQTAASLAPNTGGGFGQNPYGPPDPGAGGGAGAPEGGWPKAAHEAAVKAGFSNPDVFVRLIKQESNFNPNEESSAGALGIAQFMPSTAKMLGVNPLDPIASLAASAKYLAKMERDYAGFHGRPGIVNALWGYNAGEGNLQKGILPAETLKYLQIILGGSYGFASGHLFTEPTMTLGLKTGMRGVIGETGQPERLLGVNDTSAYDAMQRLRMPSLMPTAADGGYQFSGAATPDRLVGAGTDGAGPIERQGIQITLGKTVIADLWVTGREIAIETARYSETRSSYKTGGSR